MAEVATPYYINARERFLAPQKFIESDLEAVYGRNEIVVGWKEGIPRLFEGLSRQGLTIISGMQEGDEGKGRIVDNVIGEILDGSDIISKAKRAKVTRVAVTRDNGGSNAGHTVEKDGVRSATHQLPSSFFYEQAVGVMDRGMVIHPADLVTELEDAEKLPGVGDLRGKMLLSQDAMLATDLERAEEVLNRHLSSGKSSGGTGNGISTAVAGTYARLGHRVRDLMAENWRDEFSKKYDMFAKKFAAFEESTGLTLATTQVPDLNGTRRADEKREKGQPKSKVTKFVGTKEEFLDRLEADRTSLIKRDIESRYNGGIGFVVDTFSYHSNIWQDSNYGIVIEKGQSVGLHPQLGRYPDVTSTGTSALDVVHNTGFPLYTPSSFENNIGIFKLTYMSSVGDVRMPTDSNLERKKYGADEVALLDEDKAYAAWIRDEAHEYGTTTGRPRDICALDLELMRFNIMVGQTEMLAATHLDIAKEGSPIKVCTHYVNSNGERIPYQAGVPNWKGLKPVFIELPGWDGKSAAKARKFEDLPENAQKFMSFVQRTLGIPITMVTNGPDREAFMKL